MGGSMGGLLAAAFLRDEGFEAGIFERSTRPLESRGAGIVLHPATTAPIAQDVGAYSTATGFERYLDRAGDITHEHAGHYRFTSYRALQLALVSGLDADRYHFGHEVTSFTLDEQATVTLTDGERRRFDLLICADGVRSRARNVVARGTAGFRRVRRMARDGGGAQPLDRGGEHVRGCHHLLHRSRRPILIYPIPGPDGDRPGDRLINWERYRNVSADQLRQTPTARDGRLQDISVSADRVSLAAVAELRENACDTFPPQVAELVCTSPEPFVQVVFDLAVDHMAFGSAALIGDAAFALRPHIASGTAKAAEDGRTLARPLAEAGGCVPDALARWEARSCSSGAQPSIARGWPASVRRSCAPGSRVSHSPSASTNKETAPCHDRREPEQGLHGDTGARGHADRLGRADPDR